MKRLLAVIALVLLPTIAQATPIFYEDFETGMDGWTASGLNAGVAANQVNGGVALVSWAGANLSGSLSTSFSVATAGTYDLGLLYGFGESACQCFEQTTLNVWIDAAVIGSVNDPSPTSSNSFSATLFDLDLSVFLTAGLHALVLDITRNNPPLFLRGPFYLFDGLSIDEQVNEDVDPAPVPEPGTLALLALPAAFLVRRRVRRA